MLSQFIYNFVSIRASGLFHTRIDLLKSLSQCAGKPAYTVLRGLGAGNSPRLPDYPPKFMKLNNIYEKYANED